MSGTVPRLPRQLAAPVLLGALCLIGAGSALAADHPRVTAKPLWNAFPLDPGRPTTTAKAAESSAPQASTTAAPNLAEHPQQSAPVAVLVLFYSAIAGLLLGAGALAVRQLRRSRTPTGAGRG